jgi:hypothetical protein
MLELSKNILKKVSFDLNLFQKELKKALTWIENSDDFAKFKDWCLNEFGQSHKLILQKIFVD